MSDTTAQNRRQFPRWAIGESARLSVGGRVLDCTIADISAGGARVALDAAPTEEPAGTATLLLSGLPPFHVEILRRDDSQLGLRFAAGAQYFFR